MTTTSLDWKDRAFAWTSSFISLTEATIYVIPHRELSPSPEEGKRRYVTAYLPHEPWPSSLPDQLILLIRTVVKAIAYATLVTPALAYLIHKSLESQYAQADQEVFKNLDPTLAQILYDHKLLSEPSQKIIKAYLTKTGEELQTALTQIIGRQVEVFAPGVKVANAPWQLSIDLREAIKTKLKSSS